MSAETFHREPPGSNAAWYQPLVLVLAALAAGIAIDGCVAPPAALWWWCAAGLLFAWAALWRWKGWRWSGERRERLASGLLLGAVLAIGGTWHHDRWNLFREDEISRALGEESQPAVVEGVAVTSPKLIAAPPPTALRTIPKGDESELVVWVTAIRHGQHWTPASGWANLSVDGHLVGLHAGDRLRVMALASQPAAPLNPGEFDFRAFKRGDRILCRLRGQFPESVQLLERGWRWSPRRYLADLRQTGGALLRRYISPARATLAAAILIGSREQLDPDRNEAFLVTGAIHILSISGLHVGILAQGFWLLFRTGILPKKLSLLAAMGLTMGYAWLTDMQPPVVRATVLVSAICAARLLGRQALGFNTLAAAGIAVLALNPHSLFLAGTQLSFLAVAVMILFSAQISPRFSYLGFHFAVLGVRAWRPLFGRFWLARVAIWPLFFACAALMLLALHPLFAGRASADPLENLVAGTRPWPLRWIARAGDLLRQVVLLGVVIWLASLPLIWRQYNLISPVGLALNPLIWIPITVALYSGFGVLLLGWLLPPLGDACGWLCDASLYVVEWFILGGRALGGYYWLPAPPGWWIALFYIALGLYAAFPRLRPSRLWCGAIAAAWISGALLFSSRFPQAASNFSQPDSRPLVCTFVAVGHGTCVLLELPDGRTLLYDAGRLGAPLSAVRPISAVLWGKGITHLDAVVVSHADSDHFNALPGLLERFSVGAIYVSPVMFEDQDLEPAVKELRLALARLPIPLRYIHAGDSLRAGGGARLEVLHPPRKGVLGSDNANSIVLLVEYAGRRILLPGDLESPGLDDLLAEEPLHCDVVMAPHHGSQRSDPVKLALWSRPEFVVISGERGMENASNVAKVEDSYRARGARVFHTDVDGAVRLEISALGVTAAGFRHHDSPPR